MLEALMLELLLSVCGDTVGALLIGSMLALVLDVLNGFLSHSKTVNALCVWSMRAMLLLHLLFTERLWVFRWTLVSPSWGLGSRSINHFFV